MSSTTSPSVQDARLAAQRALRGALGHFATGVTVITAQQPAQDGWVGLTVNSFSSVSLEPPLVLWSLSNKSPNLDAFSVGTAHVIHILAEPQKDLAYQFSNPKADKFANVTYAVDPQLQVPVLEGCTARFYCETDRIIEGGDHSIILARVLKFDTADHPPLLFVKGNMLTPETCTPL
jgi:flavin reductase (DIM6/NTAB) family NADH-FMN oxidoreductase RutF